MRWTPDGTRVAYVGTRGWVSNLWVQPLSGGPPKQITDFRSDMIWSFDWARDNRLVLARGRMNQDILLISRPK